MMKFKFVFIVYIQLYIGSPSLLFKQIPKVPRNMLTKDELKEHFLEFANETTVSCVRYFCDTTTNWKHRLFWFLVFIFSLIYTGWLIVTRYIKWDEDRLEMGDDPEETFAFEIPFPTVTICPPLYYASVRVKRVANAIQNGRAAVHNPKETIYLAEQDTAELKPLNRLALEIFSQICDYKWNSSQPIANYSHDMSELFTKMLHSIVPEVDEVAICTLGPSYPVCSEIVTDIMTEYGLCYTFNSLERKDLYNLENVRYPFSQSNNTEHGRQLDNWSLDTGYTSTTSENSYPFRLPDPYIGLGFDYNSNRFNKTPRCGGGFKFAVHLPGELIQGRQKIIQVPGNKNFRIAITPKIRKANKDIIKFSLERRKCYFEGERKLQYFNIYTEDNCGVECMTAYIIETCKCVPYFLPQDKNYPMCSIDQQECYKRNKFEFNNKRYFIENDEYWSTCSCLPTCNYIEYETEIKEIVSNFNNQTTSGLLIFYFEKFKFHANLYSENVDVLAFISEFGGLFGLILGMSLFSVFELIYYFCVAFFIKNVRQGYNLAKVEKKAIKNVKVFSPQTHYKEIKSFN